jgi:hypothetical protein
MLAATTDAPSVNELFPRVPYAIAALGYGVASLTAAWGLWRQGNGLVRALAVWAVLGSLCILAFGYAAKGRMAMPLANYLVIASPFLVLPWGATWYVRRERQRAHPNGR